MSWTLAVLLGASAAAAPPPNLDFSAGKLSHWDGQGFALTPAGASSAGCAGKALLHRTLVLPASATAVHFTAAAYRPDGTEPGEMLDVVLEAANRDFLPLEVRSGEKWVPAARVGGPDGRRLRQYRWPVEGYAGRRVRLALVDSDERPGCHLVVGGFQVVTRDDGNARLFAQDMQKLQKEHGLGRMLRYDSKHFLALSNADAGYTEYRLYNCETIYGDFFGHFRKRGFAVRAPAEKMMVAIFATQSGLEAYIGHKMSAAVTGLYHPPSNRLVVYDYASNRAFLAGKKFYEDAARSGSTDLERERRTVTFGRHIRDRRDDTNISTVMHEVAHQLSFNCGLLNRKGDVPAWLAEGLAVYCESTVKGAWQGIGEPNPGRAGTLAGPARGRGEFLPLRALASGDDWLRKATTVDQVVLGYAQSWALFRLLIREQPKQLRAYLQTIYPRRTSEHRLADFVAAFGGDLPKLERRFRAYLYEVVRKEASR
jgi:hypothetical protein